MDSLLSSQVPVPLISVRLLTMDYYLTNPSTDNDNHLDPIYSMFRSAPIKKAPVLRVFGPTPGGQKACLHIHGIFPYFYVPMPSEDNPGFIYRLAASLDKALNISMFGAAEQNMHHVFKIVEVSGKPYYGYHAREHKFAKIYFYNPFYMKRAADLLAAGSVMGQILQPHYAHIPYPLQFMMDYNLQGMTLIHLKAAKFRHSFKSHNSSSTSSWSGMSQEPTQRLFNVKAMPPEMLAPSSLQPVSSCEIELDAVACDVMNNNEDLMVTLGPEDLKKSGNPGLESIWEDERLRRIRFGIDLGEHPLTPPSSPPRLRPLDAKTESEQFWADRFEEALEALREKGILDDCQEGVSGLDATANFNPGKSVVYPHETPDDSMLQAATMVEEHLASLNISGLRKKVASSQEFDFDTSDLFDTTVVDEDLCTQVAGLSTKQDTVILDSDDDELVELLEELKQVATSKKQSDQILSQTSEESLIMTQLSKEKNDRDVVESLEMTQINWDDDPFKESQEERGSNSPGFDDDSFWENFDFDSVLN